MMYIQVKLILNPHTLKLGIENMLKNYIPEVQKIRSINE